jgi:hypothetical protein
LYWRKKVISEMPKNRVFRTSACRLCGDRQICKRMHILNMGIVDDTPSIKLIRVIAFA